MQRYDTADTLHYLDPPYLAETRNARQAGMAYAVDMATPAQHRALIAVARELRGHVVIGGYPSALYAELLGDWTMVLKSTHAESASDRIERCGLSRVEHSRGDCSNDPLPRATMGNEHAEQVALVQWAAWKRGATVGRRAAMEDAA